MSTWGRLVVLVVAVTSLLGMAASPVAAVTWDNSGNTAFTATAGTVGLSSTGVVLTCTTATSTGTAGAVTPGPVLTVPLTTTFTPCHLAGVAATMECGQTFTGTTQGGTFGPVTGALDTTCSLYQSGTKVCHLSGSASATYQSPASSFGGAFITTTGALLAVIHGSNGTCPLGDVDLVHVPAISRRIIAATGGTGFGGPRFTRTA